MMRKGLFVTATDTNVGKTFVSAALMRRFRAERPMKYWKPVQTGIEVDDDTATVERESGCGGDEIVREGVRLERPLSPHLSARLAGVTIEIDNLLTIFERERPNVVEGAGGVLVPLNERELMIELIAALRLPAVIAARTALGTINHTLLTIEALRRRDIEIAGVVMCGEPNDENRRAIETYGNVRVVTIDDLEAYL